MDVLNLKKKYFLTLKPHFLMLFASFVQLMLH